MADIKLGIDLDWEEQPGDGTPCGICKEPVFYKMHVMIIVSGPERAETKHKLCDSCYNALEDE